MEAVGHLVMAAVRWAREGRAAARLELDHVINAFSPRHIVENATRAGAAVLADLVVKHSLLLLAGTAAATGPVGAAISFILYGLASGLALYGANEIIDSAWYRRIMWWIFPAAHSPPRVVWQWAPAVEPAEDDPPVVQEEFWHEWTPRSLECYICSYMV